MIPYVAISFISYNKELLYFFKIYSLGGHELTSRIFEFYGTYFTDFLLFVVHFISTSNTEPYDF
jgi:hypothetical protein